MKKLLTALLLLASPAAFATAPAPIYCIAASLTDCSSTAQVGNGTQGDIWWKAFGKFNDLGNQLGIFSSQPANEIIGTGPSGGLPGLESLSSAGIAAFTGTITPGDCAKWSAAGVLEDSGGACGGGGGSGTVTDGTGTTTANELLLSSATAHAYTLSATLPTSALPALTGDVTSSAGSNSVTVSKVNGVSIPISATCTGTDVNGAFTSAPCALLNTAQSWTAAQTFGAITVTSCAGCSTSSISNNTILGNNSGSTGAATGLTPAQAIGVLNSASADATCTTATFTFTLSDANGQVNCSDTVAQTVTIPANASVGFAVGTLLTVQNSGTGVVTLSPGSGVTVTSAAYGSSTSQTYSLGGTYGFIQIQKTATDTWNVVAWDTPANQGIAGKTNATALAVLEDSTNATLSGCTASASTLGPMGGVFTQPATPCTTVTLTVSVTAPNGWHCSAGDKTQMGNVTPSFIPQWYEGSNTTTSCTLPIPSAAQVASDVISVQATGWY